MADKIHVGKNTAVDLAKLVSHITEKSRVIKATPAKDISAVFLINVQAKRLHPDYTEMTVEKVTEHKGAGAKTFLLKGENAAFFRAGQYLSVSLKIGDSILTRPYSISSAPSLTKEGKYSITVRRTADGFASDYILDNWKEGEKVTVSEPLGNFMYEELRDEEDVIALAGGSGITPFLSMAHAIADGDEDFRLTILFGSKTKDSILFKEELDAIAKTCDKVKVVYVLSDEKKKGYENGFINADIIKKYAPADRSYSVFMCGPEAMYRFAEKELEKLGLDRKHVRREMLGVTKRIWEKENYPTDAKGKVFSAVIRLGSEEKTIPVSADEPLLAAIERAGIAAPSRCRSGECGWCRSKLISGEIYVPAENDEGRRAADKQFGYIHPCATFALSDLVVEVPATYIK